MQDSLQRRASTRALRFTKTELPFLQRKGESWQRGRGGIRALNGTGKYNKKKRRKLD